MNDEILDFLQQARAAALANPARSRELSLAVTKIEEAMLWRQFDLQLKSPAIGPFPETPVSPATDELRDEKER